LDTGAELLSSCGRSEWTSARSLDLTLVTQSLRAEGTLNVLLRDLQMSCIEALRLWKDADV
jgi:hypothetical protein